jgi:aldehyde:ferredoxin oxidoreductase
MPNGYWQKLLRVDLTTGAHSVEPIPEADLKRFVGGAGLGAEILRRELPPRLPPYDPRNRVIFATGPFQGPPVPGGAKFSIVGISPLTGTFADSAAGASFGPVLKKAGYDLLVIQGRADRPVYLRIVDDSVEIRDAGGLWGRDTVDTVEGIRAAEGDPQMSVACIGPAGERRVAIACVAIDTHSFAGRAGLGAVMGAKNLKAVAVRGTREVPVADPAGARELLKKHQLAIHQATMRNKFRIHGTPGLCETAEGLGDMPIKYWDGDVWPAGAKRLGAPNYTEVLKARPLPCKFCPVGCHRRIEISEPSAYALSGPGPEYETLGMMGTNLLIDDPKAVAKANDVANRLGVDTISGGAMVGFAMQCWERGWITAKETGGLAMTWGNPDALIGLIGQIGRREGFGARFAEGTLAAARGIHPDAAETVVHNKGLDYPAHDPRACHSLAPGYATGTRGACHFRGPSEDIEMGGFFIPEAGITQGTVKFFERANQARVAAVCQDLGALANSLVICLFMIDGGELSLSSVAEIFNAITGWGWTPQALLEAGERGFTAQRLVNLRDGHGAATDKLPKKMRQSAKEGFRAGKAIPFEDLMTDYYAARGWDPAGAPTPATLARLGLTP